MVVRIKNDDGTIKRKYAVYFIKIRLWTKDDPLAFLSYPTLQAVLFHELAHLRYMSHSFDFMILLKHIYMFATEKELFKLGELNETNSSYSREKLIFWTGGYIDWDTLKELWVEEEKEWENC